MNYYIDFDGVILDTEPILFEEWDKIPNNHLLPDVELENYIRNANWEVILSNAKEINDSIYCLQQMDLNTTGIITRVHSLGNEARLKTEWLRKNNIKQNVIFVPYNLNKSDVVLAENNILIDDGIKPLLPYKRPMTKDGFFKKYEYVYDEYYDCYICPGNQVLIYRTTNRDGNREYKSCGAVCAQCPYLSQCTESRDHVKTITRHIWEPYMEICEDIRQTLGMKDLYAQRKETIERLFGTAKENHGFRYTQMYGKARMEMKVGLTFACMNLKKLAKIKAKWGLPEGRKTRKISILNTIRLIKEKWLWDVNPRAALSTV